MGDLDGDVRCRRQQVQELFGVFASVHGEITTNVDDHGKATFIDRLEYSPNRVRMPAIQEVNARAVEVQLQTFDHQLGGATIDFLARVVLERVDAAERNQSRRKA